MIDRPFPTARAAGGRDDSVEQDTVVLPDEDENPASTTRRGDNENDHRDANGHYQRQRQPDDHVRQPVGPRPHPARACTCVRMPHARSPRPPMSPLYARAAAPQT